MSIEQVKSIERVAARWLSCDTDGCLGRIMYEVTLNGGPCKLLLCDFCVREWQKIKDGQ